MDAESGKGSPNTDRTPQINSAAIAPGIYGPYTARKGGDRAKVPCPVPSSLLSPPRGSLASQGCSSLRSLGGKGRYPAAGRGLGTRVGDRDAAGIEGWRRDEVERQRGWGQEGTEGWRGCRDGGAGDMEGWREQLHGGDGWTEGT